jgi:hypothetical protein
MSMDLTGFDANEVEPNTGFEHIPPGEYEACIVNSERKTTKSGTGEYLNLELTILNGPYQNRRLFEKLNLQNPNAKAVEIAKGTLSSICRAVGVLKPGNSSELHNLPLRISVGVEKREDTGELTNRIKGFKSRLASPVSAPMVTGQTQPQYATAGTQKAPWVK